MKILVVMPTYNEAESIESSLRNLLQIVPNCSVLVVDDASPDGTAKIAERIARETDRVKVLRRVAKIGLGPAYLAGFEYGFANDFDYLVEMDADGSHRPEDLLELLGKAPTSDLVIGSRWIPGGKVQNWPLSRQLISRFGNSYARFMLGTKIKDMTSGFRVFRSDFLKDLIALDVSSQGYSFQVELAYRASKSGKVVEVPIVFVERHDGKSKMTLAIVLEALAKVTYWGLKRVF